MLVLEDLVGLHSTVHLQILLLNMRVTPILLRDFIPAVVDIMVI